MSEESADEEEAAPNQVSAGDEAQADEGEKVEADDDVDEDESLDEDDGETTAYRGALGAFPYAFRQSDSWSFRFYWVVATLVALFIVVVFALSLVGIIASTQNQPASVTLVRAFVLLVMVAVLLPVIGPVLLVARRHRLELPVDPSYDRGLAVGGMAFIAALYFGLIISAPGRMGPDSLDWLGIVPPVLAAAAIWWIHRRLGSVEGAAAGNGAQAD
jgi:hypothetical protein